MACDAEIGGAVSMIERGRFPPRRRRWRPPAGRAGFTLIELGIVLLIIGVVLTLVVPRLRDSAHAQLVAQTRRLALQFRFLREEAILNGRTFRLIYDLDGHRYWSMADQEGGGAGGFESGGGVLQREVRIPEPIGFADVDLPYITGKVYEGMIYTDFYPDGSVDLTVIHLVSGEDAYTLAVPNPFTGRVIIEPGYLDFVMP